MKIASLKKKLDVVRKSVRQTLNIARYSGRAVFCPICHSSFSSFAPHGRIKRENAKCWRCGSLERHRLFYKYLEDKTNFFSGAKKRLLHFAPEKMFHGLISKMANIEYVPCDLFPDRYDHPGVAKVHQIDMTNIPFAENTFDIIFCSHVLEHIPNDSRAMQELFRVMKVGGWGIFQVPLDYNREVTYEDFSITSPEEREIAFGQHDHVRWYGKDYKQRLEGAGFNVKADEYVKSFTKEDLHRFGLDLTELVFYCEKL